MTVRPSTQPKKSDLDYLKGLGEVPQWLTLNGLRDWSKLNLGSSAVSDDGLIRLRGLLHLVELPRLRMLFMYGIAACPVGLACQRQSFPGRAAMVPTARH
jgi:hypothetical protein